MIDDCGPQIEESLENSAADFKVTHVLLRNTEKYPFHHEFSYEEYFYPKNDQRR